jgi:hypothetical protein
VWRPCDEVAVTLPVGSYCLSWLRATAAFLNRLGQLRVQPDFFLSRLDLYPVCEGLMGQTVKV